MKQTRSLLLLITLFLLVVFLLNMDNQDAFSQPAWKEVCSLYVRQYQGEGEQADPAAIVVASIRMKNNPKSKLRVNNGRILLRSYPEAFILHDQGHCFDDGKWSIEKWPLEANQTTSEPVSYEILLQGLTSDKIKDALENNLLQKTDIAALVKALDATLEDMKQGYPYPFFDSEGGHSWGSLPLEEKQAKAKELLQQAAEESLRFSRYLWCENGNTVYGLTGFDMNGIEGIPLPRALYDVFKSLNLPPQRFIDFGLKGRKLVLFNVRMSDIFWSGGDTFQADFFYHMNRLILAGETRIWVFSEDGKKSTAYDLPIQAKPISPSIRPAFFHTENELFVFGQSKSDRAKASVFKVSLSDLY